MECYSNIMIHFLTQANFQDPQHLLFIFPSTVCYLGSLVYPWSINYVLISDPFSASVGPMMAHRTTLSWVHTVPFLSFLPPCWCELNFARAFLIFPLLHLSCIVLFFFFYKGGSDWHSQNTCSSNCTNLTGSSSALGHFPFLCLLASTLLKSSLCQVPYSPFSLFMLRDDLGPWSYRKLRLLDPAAFLIYIHSKSHAVLKDRAVLLVHIRVFEYRLPYIYLDFPLHPTCCMNTNFISSPETIKLSFPFAMSVYVCGLWARISECLPV